jgi:hypothetical protein
MRIVIVILILAVCSFAVEINIDAAAGHRPISPYIFGKNNSLSDDPKNPVATADWKLYRDAGITIFRENGGNNSTKYNWRRKLTSHPDWYNNVYAHDWDYAAQSLQDNIPGARGLWAFQLIGRVAGNSSHNFNDWAYNGSQWWEGVNNNWAGGGGPDIGDGDPDLYLVEWPADSTVGILDQWDNLGLDRDMYQYWNMDNEPEVWNGTHDDVYPATFPAEEYLQKYFAVAKAARAKYPDIKLLGPVSTNEWQWYNWNDDKIRYNGKNYVWLEYFILRIAEEQQASGIRLLDVLDVHFYPGETSAADIVQLHRVWFDKTYTYPGANGVKRAGPGGWDNSITKEYLFERCNEWLKKYLGADHGVTLSVTEMDIQSSNANLNAVWYASTLGVFADQGVEIFTPWSWKSGMYEVLHLFRRYGKTIRVLAGSNDETSVSAYASMNNSSDSLTVILVNRKTDQTQTVNVNLTNFQAADGDYPTLRISNLPNSETFKSHAKNALQKDFVALTQNSLNMTLPAMSITAVVLTGKVIETSVDTQPERTDLAMDVYPNPFNPGTTLSYQLATPGQVSIYIFDVLGRQVRTVVNEQQSAGAYRYRIDGSQLASGVYFVRLVSNRQLVQKKIVLVR